MIEWLPQAPYTQRILKLSLDSSGQLYGLAAESKGWGLWEPQILRDYGIGWGLHGQALRPVRITQPWGVGPPPASSCSSGQ